jgi:thiol-disulfide isomerase/thioredoxin
MRIKNPAFICGAVLLFAIWLFEAIPTAHASKGITIEQAYPGLASGILKSARLDPLEKGVVLKTDDLQVDESTLDQILKEADPNLRPQYEKNLFFIMEQEALEKVVLLEARKAGVDTNGSPREAIMSFLNKKVSGITVSDDEVRSFYGENKADLGGASFDQVKDDIKDYLLETKRHVGILAYVETLGEQLNIRVDAKWAEKQNLQAKNNPVDRARTSGKPTMVEFGATGCVPCDMMQPILDNLRKKYQDRLNVVFIHVGEEQILGARYGISSIPVQAFFDRSGKEAFRHTGFYAQAEVEKKLAEMGVR